MTAIFGPTGSGKTALLMFLLAMFEQAMTGRNGAVVFFDKDRAAEILVLVTGGTYLVCAVARTAAGPVTRPARHARRGFFLRTWVSG